MRPEIKVGLIVGFVAIVGGSFLWLSNDSKELDSLPLDKQTVDASSANEIKHTGDARAAKPETGARGERERLTGSRERDRQPAQSPMTTRRNTPRPDQRDVPTPPSASSPDPGSLGTRFPDRGGATNRPAATPEAAGGPDAPKDSPAAEKIASPKPDAEAADKPVAAHSPAPELRPPADSPAPVERNSLSRNPIPTPRQKTIKIQPGDYLITIAENEYGDGAFWRAIKAANPGLDENCLKVGQEITIPDKAEAQRLVQSNASASGPAAAKGPANKVDESKPANAGRATYVVERGDTLSKIAKNVLRDAKRWREIYELNRARLDSPDILPVGVELTMPPVSK